MSIIIKTTVTLDDGTLLHSSTAVIGDDPRATKPTALSHVDGPYTAKKSEPNIIGMPGEVTGVVKRGPGRPRKDERTISY